MPDLVDLEKLDDATVSRLRSAIRRYEHAQKTKRERRAQTAAATAVSASARKARTAAGIKVRRGKYKITKSGAQQRARKAVKTMRERYPERFGPKRCCWPDCASIAVAHGQCRKHDQAWRRSGLKLQKWFAQMSVGT